MTPITGIVLAGGKSQRMGQDKAMILWRGKALINWVIDAIKPLCHEVIVSSNTLGHQFNGFQVVSDTFKDIGPIAGIEAGLRAATYPTTIIVSCDTPLLPTELFSFILSKHTDFQISLAAHDGINEPMIGVFSKEVYHYFHDSIIRGEYKPPSVIKTTKWQNVNISREMSFYSNNMFRNFNLPEDLIDNSN
jgi:molybdopterin-guanine dinucleotide biosynthesis protein A